MPSRSCDVRTSMPIITPLGGSVPQRTLCGRDDRKREVVEPMECEDGGHPSLVTDAREDTEHHDRRDERHERYRE